MSDSKAKMHQNRFPLGLCPRPRWRSLQRPTDPLTRFKGPTSKGRGREEKEGPALRWYGAPEWLVRPCSYGRKDGKMAFCSYQK